MRGALFLLAVLLAGCTSLPDMRTAARMHEAGDVDGARAQYAELARYGLPAARIALADSLAETDIEGRQSGFIEGQYQLAADRDPRGLARLARRDVRNPAATPAIIEENLSAMMLREARGEPILAADIAEFLFSRGGGRNLPEVSHWARRAVSIGDPRGHYLLALLCDAPLAVEPDLACARKHYHRAATTMPEAAGALVAIAQREPGERAPADLARDVMKNFNDKQRLSVYHAYEERVQGGPQTSVAESLLGPLAVQLPTPKAYPDPLPDCAENRVPLDPSVADAVAAGNALASAYAANGGMESREKFFDLVSRIAVVDPLGADILMADAWLDGRMVAVDPALAEERLSKHAACNADAAFRLATLYRDGLLDEPDYPAATRWYESAGEGGLSKAWYVLTRQYLYAPALKPDWSRASAYADRAREAGYLAVDGLLDSAPPGVRPAPERLQP